MSVGLDEDGNPVAAIGMTLHIWVAGTAEYFDVDGAPLDMNKVTEEMETRVLLARQRIVSHGITDADLQEIVLKAGRNGRSGVGEDYDAVCNVADAAADEQRRRDLERASK